MTFPPSSLCLPNNEGHSRRFGSWTSICTFFWFLEMSFTSFSTNHNFFIIVSLKFRMLPQFWTNSDGVSKSPVSSKNNTQTNFCNRLRRRNATKKHGVTSYSYFNTQMSAKLDKLEPFYISLLSSHIGSNYETHLQTHAQTFTAEIAHIPPPPLSHPHRRFHHHPFLRPLSSLAPST